MNIKGYIAIDIEFTGTGKDDIIFAYGQADSSIQERDKCNSKSICLNLFKPPEKTWEEYWIERNWNMDTFKFWNTCIDMLDFLQDSTKVNLVDTQDEFVKEINNLLLEAENHYTTSIIISDTLLVDTPYVSNLLTIYGYNGLNNTRKGEYRRGLEVSSFIIGALHSTPEDCDYKSVINFKKSNDYSTMTMTTVHNHDPKEDAKYILHLFFRGLSYMGK
jgi:hypothetical protein